MKEAICLLHILARTVRKEHYNYNQLLQRLLKVHSRKTVSFWRMKSLASVETYIPLGHVNEETTPQEGRTTPRKVGFPSAMLKRGKRMYFSFPDLQPPLGMEEGAIFCRTVAMISEVCWLF